MVRNAKRASLIWSGLPDPDLGHLMQEYGIFTILNSNSGANAIWSGLFGQDYLTPDLGRESSIGANASGGSTEYFMKSLSNDKE